MLRKGGFKNNYDAAFTDTKGQCNLLETSAILKQIQT